MDFSETAILAMTGAIVPVIAFLAGEPSHLSQGKLRPGLGSIATAAGIVFVWMIAHQLVRGTGAWGMSLWPPDVTKRFPALIALGTGVGVCVWWMEPWRGRVWSVIRFGVRIAAMGAIALVLTGPMRRNGADIASVIGACIMISALGAAWWWIFEYAGNRGSGILHLTTLAMIVVGFGIVAGMYTAYSLGYVAVIGGPILLGAAWCAVRYPTIARGPVVGATIASALVVVMGSACLYTESVPIAPLPFILAVPAGVLISTFPRVARMGRGARWFTQLGVTGAMIVVAVILAMGAWVAEFGGV